MTENNNIILPDSLDEFKFDTGYVLWYHSVTEKSWNKNSYINLCEDLPGKVIRNADQLWGIYNALDYNFTAGIFFLMKEGIMPLWEDISNSKGGYWSFKVLKKNSNEIWKKLTAGIVGNSLTCDPINMKCINGISISPKISNCVMKIWNNNNDLIDVTMFTKEIDYLDQDTIRYNKHN